MQYGVIFQKRLNEVIGISVGFPTETEARNWVNTQLYRKGVMWRIVPLHETYDSWMATQAQ